MVVVTNQLARDALVGPVEQMMKDKTALGPRESSKAAASAIGLFILTLVKNDGLRQIQSAVRSAIRKICFLQHKKPPAFSRGGYRSCSKLIGIKTFPPPVERADHIFLNLLNPEIGFSLGESFIHQGAPSFYF
jgi:hypothetical protein